jgi:uncharacterized membrane protein
MKCIRVAERLLASQGLGFMGLVSLFPTCTVLTLLDNQTHCTTVARMGINTYIARNIAYHIPRENNLDTGYFNLY